MTEPFTSVSPDRASQRISSPYHPPPAHSPYSLPHLRHTFGASSGSFGGSAYNNQARLSYSPHEPVRGLASIEHAANAPNYISSPRVQTNVNTTGNDQSNAASTDPALIEASAPPATARGGRRMSRGELFEEYQSVFDQRRRTLGTPRALRREMRNAAGAASSAAAAAAAAVVTTPTRHPDEVQAAVQEAVQDVAASRFAPFVPSSPHPRTHQPVAMLVVDDLNVSAVLPSQKHQFEEPRVLAIQTSTTRRATPVQMPRVLDDREREEHQRQLQLQQQLQQYSQLQQQLHDQQQPQPKPKKRHQSPYTFEEAKRPEPLQPLQPLQPQRPVVVHSTPVTEYASSVLPTSAIASPSGLSRSLASVAEPAGKSQLAPATDLAAGLVAPAPALVVNAPAPSASYSNFRVSGSPSPVDTDAITFSIGNCFNVDIAPKKLLIASCATLLLMLLFNCIAFGVSWTTSSKVDGSGDISFYIRYFEEQVTPEAAAAAAAAYQATAAHNVALNITTAPFVPWTSYSSNYGPIGDYRHQCAVDDVRVPVCLGFGLPMLFLALLGVYKRSLDATDVSWRRAVIFFLIIYGCFMFLACCFWQAGCYAFAKAAVTQQGTFMLRDVQFAGGWWLSMVNLFLAFLLILVQSMLYGEEKCCVCSC